jgi:hypothetical protein
MDATAHGTNGRVADGEVVTPTLVSSSQEVNASQG